QKVLKDVTKPTRDQHCHAQSNQRPVEDVLIFDLKANSKIHDGLCQHCKGVLEWKVKYKKYKTLTQAKKCVKCSQKTVKDAYYIICKPCSLQLEICCKCGKKEEIVIPLNSHEDKEEDDEQKKKRRGRGKKDLDDLDSDDDYNDDDDDDDDLSDLRGDDGDKGADLESDSEPKKQQNGSDVLPDVSTVSFKD
uniref:Chromosome 9 open reading frame 85 n=1 Tax=Gasterosteus aculeatus aculeatus TaxID=481459 RepID=A0AAQ4QHX5_GASAC